LFYEAVVVDNVSPDDSDRIEVQCLRLSQKFGTAFHEKGTEVSPVGIPNMDKNTTFDQQPAKVNIKTTFTCYPLGFAGSQTNGKNIYPEIGDRVFITFLDDDMTQLYYILGSKKIEQKAKDENPTSLKIDFLDVVGIPTGDIPSSDRHFFKVLFKTLANNSLTFIDRAKDLGILLRNKSNFISMFNNATKNEIHLKTGGNYSVKIDEKNGVISIVTANGNFVKLIDEGNEIKIHSNGVLNIDAGSTINMNSKDINITATGGLVLTGGRIDFN
jgi:hypothetical protein